MIVFWTWLKTLPAWTWAVLSWAIAASVWHFSRKALVQTDIERLEKSGIAARREKITAIREQYKDDVKKAKVVHAKKKKKLALAAVKIEAAKQPTAIADVLNTAFSDDEDTE